MKQLATYLERFSSLRIGVVGDVMLDRYIWGRTTRISQEAPVPVVAVNRQSQVPGGAANVARNILSLGGRVELFGVVGEDRDGEELLNILRQAGADCAGVLKVKDRPTTVKTRVLAGNQQVVRIDQEDVGNISSAYRRKLRKMIYERMDSGEMQGLIIEDYAKGVLGKEFMQDLVNYARQRGIIATLDPHPNNAFNVKGLTLMTPNRNEAFSLAGVKYVRGIGNPMEDKALQRVASIVIRKWRPDYLLVTLGAEGMALFSSDGGEAVHIPTKARQVFDVSGAGDTVMATIVLALLAGAAPVDAAKIANVAAGVVVGRVGTSAIEADVLKNAINS